MAPPRFMVVVALDIKVVAVFMEPTLPIFNVMCALNSTVSFFYHMLHQSYQTKAISIQVLHMLGTRIIKEISVFWLIMVLTHIFLSCSIPSGKSSLNNG